MVSNTIKCEVIHIDGDAQFSPGGSKVKNRSSWTIGRRTPQGICARSYMSIFPVASAMRFLEKTPWGRGKDYVDITCPEGHTKYRLSKLRTEEKQ